MGVHLNEATFSTQIEKNHSQLVSFHSGEITDEGKRVTISFSNPFGFLAIILVGLAQQF